MKVNLFEDHTVPEEFLGEPFDDTGEGILDGVVASCEGDNYTPWLEAFDSLDDYKMRGQRCVLIDGKWYYAGMPRNKPGILDWQFTVGDGVFCKTAGVNAIITKVYPSNLSVVQKFDLVSCNAESCITIHTGVLESEIYHMYQE